jgi:hypothetical protein
MPSSEVMGVTVSSFWVESNANVMPLLLLLPEDEIIEEEEEEVAPKPRDSAHFVLDVILALFLLAMSSDDEIEMAGFM